MINKLKYWCNKVLPLVYDDSLSYYEVLCKVTNKINELVNSNTGIERELIRLSTGLNEADSNIDNINNHLVQYVMDNFLNRLVWFGLTNDGHFVAYIPDSWSDIEFSTDMEYGSEYYGHLLLGYNENLFNVDNYYRG